MNSGNKDLDFLQEIARVISERSKEGYPISTDEVFDLFKDTYEKAANTRTIEVPIFIPIKVEKEKHFYTARCHVYRVCLGIGSSEEEAIQNLKKEIDLYNKSCVETERKLRIEEIVQNIFPKDRL